MTTSVIAASAQSTFNKQDFLKKNVIHNSYNNHPLNYQFRPKTLQSTNFKNISSLVFKKYTQFYRIIIHK